MRVRLAIETSNPSAHQPGLPAPGVAIGVVESGGVRVLDSEPIDTRPGADDDLLPAIARIFARHNLTPRELDSIAVSLGPGGYTALRIAAATAQMLAMSTGAACLGVPSALVAHAAFADRSRRVAVALSSKDQAAFITVFDPAAPNPPAGPQASPPPGRLMSAAELADLPADVLLADRFLPDAMKAAAVARGVLLAPLVLEPRACLAASVDIRPITPSELLPLYPREPEAVTKWRKLHPPRTVG
ncbi:MAG: tRNA (adenosine(37)-N6)-threonylcarbamoyltransferase complex dimerization subunit type 1 TsaB [Phycisphaerales bacterium]|jgi:tRNA threonylcarbamoyl adenosine modification protein YeaZ|nr:tRNA (adenosine(37)-N6)-threonylcarbamoyltransferase complex dimerization subunit type 1 TsaB [Phycisphaerales bacterium]